MGNPFKPRGSWWLAPWLGSSLVVALALAGCQKSSTATDMAPLDQAGMLFSGVEQLKGLGVNNDEVQQLVLTRQGGVTDETCIELVRLAHSHKQTFAGGETIVGLIRAGVQEQSVLELARLGQLGLWAGEAQALRLTGLPDELILAVARRRAAGEPVLSSSKASDLQNAGLTDKEILVEVNRGTTDAGADDIIAQRKRAAGGNRFVRQRGSRRRR